MDVVTRGLGASKAQFARANVVLADAAAAVRRQSRVGHAATPRGLRRAGSFEENHSRTRSFSQQHLLVTVLKPRGRVERESRDSDERHHERMISTNQPPTHAHTKFASRAGADTNTIAMTIAHRGLRMWAEAKILHSERRAESVRDDRHVTVVGVPLNSNNR